MPKLGFVANMILNLVEDLGKPFLGCGENVQSCDTSAETTPASCVTEIAG